jgi:hypothetical protein
MAIVINQKGNKLVVRATATTTQNLTSANTDAGETVRGLVLNQVYWTSNGTWTVARGANTILVLTGEGYFDFAGTGVALGEDSSANVVLTLSVGSVGSIVVDCAKISTFTSEY